MSYPRIYKEASEASLHVTDWENFCEFMAKLKPEIYEKVINLSLKEFDEMVKTGQIGEKDFRYVAPQPEEWKLKLQKMAEEAKADNCSHNFKPFIV